MGFNGCSSNPNAGRNHQRDATAQLQVWFAHEERHSVGGSSALLPCVGNNKIAHELLFYRNDWLV